MTAARRRRLPTPAGTAALLVLAVFAAGQAAPGSVRRSLPDESDRQAFRAWFVFLADARFYQPAPDITDCAALVRHAWREALRAHTPEWRRTSGLADVPALPDVRAVPPTVDGVWQLFRAGDGRTATWREFVDARTLVRYNARFIARAWQAARPGDLLYFRQEGQREPDHLMIVIGSSRFDRSAADFVVYHTGPDEHGPGELRKVRLADLLRHPAPRWRPLAANGAFVGVFRPALV